MTLNIQEIESVLKLEGEQRYKYFIKKIVGNDEVWGLYNNGWALVSDDNGDKLFPIWPAKEYAKLCSNSGWENYQPQSFTIDSFLEDLLPQLHSNKMLFAVFITPSSLGVTPTLEQIENDINTELMKY